MLATNLITEPSTNKGIAFLKSIGLVVLGILILIAAAFIYVYLSWVFPFVIVNVMLLALFAVLVLAGVGVVVSALGLQNQLLKIIIGVISALFSCYISWALFVMIWSNLAGSDIRLGTGELSVLTNGFKTLSFNAESFWYFITHPQDLWEMMQLLNDFGTTGISDWTFRGWWLWVVWSIELLVVVVPAAFFGVFVKGEE